MKKLIKKIKESKIWKWIFASCLIFAVLISSFSVSCYAAEEEFYRVPVGPFYFPSYFDIVDYDPSISYEIMIYPAQDYHYEWFMSNDQFFWGFRINYTGYTVLSYMVSHSSSDSIIVYDSINGWVDESYRDIVFQSTSYVPDQYFYFFEEILSPGSYITAEYGLYYTLYDVLRSGLFGTNAITPDMNLTLTLVSTIGALFIIGIPFVIVFFLLRFIRFI